MFKVIHRSFIRLINTIRDSGATFLVLLTVFCAPAIAQTTYTIKPGDSLGVAVWKEPELSGEIIVHPDGMFSMPLVGEIRASGRTTSEIESEVSTKLETYIPEAIVTIGVRSTVGENIYVIGQVNTPGVFNITQPTDVMQALSLAQGMTAFAAQNKIKILRRDGEEQEAIGFRYGDVVKGKKLEQNILLKDGDVVVVP